MSNFRALMKFDAKTCRQQADELKRWSCQFNREQQRFQTKPAKQIITTPVPGTSDKRVDKCSIVTVVPNDEPAVTMSSTCHDSPEPEIKRDTVGMCHVTVVVPCDGPDTSTSSTCPEPEISCEKVSHATPLATVVLPCDEPADSTCPAMSPDSAKSQLTGCDQQQNASEVMELRTECVDVEDKVKNEIINLESKLVEMWNVSPSNLLIRKKDEEISLLQQRVDLLESTCREKDEAIQQYENKLDLLSKQDQVMWKMQDQQKNLVSSLLAKVSLDKKTKFIQGTSKLRYNRTGPTLPVRKELVKASTRLLEERHKKQKEDVDKLISIVDTIAIKYPAAPSPDPASADRYSFQSFIITNPVQKEDDISVTEVFKALCLFTMDTSADEEAEYDAFLREQNRPPVIYSPVMPKPRVEWGLINTNIHRNLPKPFPFPINGAAENPDFYTEMEPGVASLKFHSGRPFGVAFGFRTSCGILPVPDEPVKGYMWDGDTKDWVIAAFY